MFVLLVFFFVLPFFCLFVFFKVFFYVHLKIPVSFLGLSSCVVKSCVCLQAKMLVRTSYLIFRIKAHVC